MISGIATSVSQSTFVQSAKGKTSWALGKVFFLFKAYVLEPLERYAIGDLRKFNGVFEWNGDKSWRIHRFGLLGSVVKWEPKTPEELANVLKQLDKTPNGRSAYRSVESLVKSSPTMLSDTSPLALLHRKEVQKFLKPHQYAEIAWELLQKFKASESRDFLTSYCINLIGMKSVAKGMLGIEESLIQRYYPDLRALGESFKEGLGTPIPEMMLKWSPGFKQKQKIYQEPLEALLQAEIKNVKRQPTKKGLLAQEIRKKIEQDPHAQNLHKDPELKSILLNLLAVDNLGILLNDAYYEFLKRSAREDRIVIDQLYEEIMKANVVQMTPEGVEKIDPQLLMDRKNMPVLDDVYQYGLKRAFAGVILVRYVQKGTECEELSLPPRTTLVISSPRQDGHPISVFSEGSRKCPGRAVAEAVFKAIVVGLIYDNSLVMLQDKEDKAEIKSWRNSLEESVTKKHKVPQVPPDLPTRLLDKYRIAISEVFNELCQKEPELQPKYRRMERELLETLG